MPSDENKPREPEYSRNDLQEIRAAERAVYERAFTQLITSVTLHVIFGKMEAGLDTTAGRGAWIDDRATRAVNRWRGHFCPTRVGLPLESEWSLKN